eukprot:CAMPEP_0172759450 /NCGR_PEP_ID=MMETSP1074-20121228/167770_1 /TAXON_ID=2916 /ORGANISM="Ceratium fusus, Strain PA161109" /LENGTH=229 /DNA_ID=CAMNT_0013593245 /DNA_START=61 /DNA_END=746 /DNA_ORIENTATION=+
MSASPKAIAGMATRVVSALGRSFPAYMCGPVGAPGIIVLQEWWGVTTQVQLQAQRISSQGYRCLVPDLYKGKLGVDVEEASHMMGNLDFPAAVGEILAATAVLKQEGSKKCGITGFCMGGALSLAASVKADGGELCCAAPFYGIPDQRFFDCSNIKIPVQAHFGTLDSLAGFSDPAAAENLKAILTKSNCPFEVHMYDGVAHGFAKKEAMFGAKHSAEAVDTAYSRLFA